MNKEYTLEQLREKVRDVEAYTDGCLWSGIDAPMGREHPYWPARRQRDYWQRRLAKAEMAARGG